MPPALQKWLEKEIRDQKLLNNLKKEHNKQLLVGMRATKKGDTAYKEAVENHKKAFDAVAETLKGTRKNAEEYGKAIVKDTKMVEDFAKVHKLSLDDAIEMYKKVRAEQKTFWQEHKDTIKKSVTGALTAVTAMAAYKKRVDEIIEGQRLFATSVSLTSANFKKTANYVEGYRSAMRNARDITKEFGVTADEAEGTIKAVAYSIRNSVKDSSKMGEQTIKTTRSLYGMSRMLGIEVSDALQFYRTQMMAHGKTSDEALKSLDTMTSAYDVMSKSVEKSVLPFKEDFFGALRDVQQELGPVSVNTLALNAAMVRVAEGASKAGLSTQALTDSMKAVPKMLKAIPAYYQYSIGNQFLGRMRKDFDPRTGEWAGAMKNLPEGLKKQMKSIEGMDVPNFMKSQMAYDVMIGSDQGISEVIKTMQGFSPTRRLAMLRQMGLSTQDILATNEMFKKGELSTKEIDKLKGKITEGQKKTVDVRERLADTMDKNLNATDRLVKETRDAGEAMLKLKESNLGLLAAVGGVTSLLQSEMFRSLAKGVLTMARGGGLGGLQGGGVAGPAQSVQQMMKSGVGGIVTAAAGVLSAGAFGYALGTYLDQAFGVSEKLSNWALSGKKEESEKRVKSHVEDITLKNAQDQAKTYAKMAETLRVIEVRGKGGVVEKRALTRSLAESRISTWLKQQGKTGDEQRKIMASLEPHLKKIPTKEQMLERDKVAQGLKPSPVAGRIRAEAALAGAKAPAAPSGVKKPTQVQHDPATKQVTFNLADLLGPYQELQQMSMAQNPKSR